MTLVCLERKVHNKRFLHLLISFILLLFDWSSSSSNIFPSSACFILWSFLVFLNHERRRNERLFLVSCRVIFFKVYIFLKNFFFWPSFVVLLSFLLFTFCFSISFSFILSSDAHFQCDTPTVYRTTHSRNILLKREIKENSSHGPKFERNERAEGADGEEKEKRRKLNKLDQKEYPSCWECVLWTDHYFLCWELRGGM